MSMNNYSSFNGFISACRPDASFGSQNNATGSNVYRRIQAALEVGYPNTDPNQFISHNYAVSGSGRIQIPAFEAPSPYDFAVQMLMATVKTISFDGSWQLTGPGVDSGYNQEGTGIIAFPQLNGSTSYTWTIDYHYAGNEPQFILARIYYYILLSRLPSILLNPAFVFHFLKRFLDNDQAPICGSTLFIMVKRYPNENDVHDLITQLRNNHVFVYFSVNDTPSGGNNPRALFDLSMYTNGYCVFSRFTGDVATYSTEVFDETYQIVAQNFVVSGSGRIELPLFKFPEPYPGEWQNFITWMITIQSHVLDSDFITLNYTFASTDGTSVLTGPDPNIDTISVLMGTGYSGWTELNGTNEYKWTIDYKYAGNEPQVIEVRLYNRNYQDFLPLPDY
ncbi:Protein CBG22630 [Caenorhabditis briggsae]|uniref:Protein CBG22630 n=1 Tax=Caenorhabditis briggsae TaxID=6238 RepID=A8Y2Q7_CAEBR|nr:Protein CBG22630 [Caenorhabditis briggsae]CAP39182.1 Protein CBG22630 [Caenorhabditis briggsae]